MNTRKCAICGKTFETDRPNQKYCRSLCKAAGEVLRRMNWEVKNPNYNKEYMQTYRKNQKAGKQ